MKAQTGLRIFVNCLFYTFALVLGTETLYAQAIGVDDEDKLYAQSKQLNQFFRRFNGEEDEKGKRYYAGDKHFQSEKLRRKYLGILFDEENTGVSDELRISFAKDVLAAGQNSILQFHGGDWFAEVQTVFTMQGRDYPVTLFMELERAQLGTKWSIYRVQSDLFEKHFARDTARAGRFLHPLSHELEFMNLRKALARSDSVSQFAIKRFVPDHLTLLIYEVSQGNLKFKSVTDVRFHFFQISGWYFEVANMNRQGYNTGWLISNLVRLHNENDRKALESYLYR